MAAKNHKITFISFFLLVVKDAVCFFGNSQVKNQKKTLI